jgi:hypothetical protein
MPKIITTYEIITEESAEDGEAAERGFGDPIDDVGVVEACVLLQGCEPSSSQFHTGIWYTMYGEMDMITGNYENISYHFNEAETWRDSNGTTYTMSPDWTEEQQRAIYNAVTRKRS